MLKESSYNTGIRNPPVENKINTQPNFGNKDWWKLVKQFISKKGIPQADIPPIQPDNKIYYFQHVLTNRQDSYDFY